MGLGWSKRGGRELEDLGLPGKDAAKARRRRGDVERAEDDEATRSERRDEVLDRRAGRLGGQIKKEVPAEDEIEQLAVGRPFEQVLATKRRDAFDLVAHDEARGPARTDDGK